MSIFDTAKKLFKNSWLLMLVYSAFMLFTVIYCGKWVVHFVLEGASVFSDETMLLPFSMYAFVMFAFLAFEYCSRCKSCSLEECLQCTKNGYSRFLLAQLKLLTLLICVFTAFMFIAYAVLYISNGVFTFRYTVQILLGILLNYFLVPFTGAAIGMFLSIFSKRLFSYLLLVFITLLGSPLILGMDVMVYETSHIDISGFFRLFSFFTPSLNWRVICQYGHSILPHRWALCLFWCLLLFGISLYKTSNQRTAKQLAKSVPAFVISVVCFAVAVMPSSKVLLESDNQVESVMADYWYYVNHSETEDKNEYADYMITEYDAELSAFINLDADVYMKMNNPTLDEYIFTLYHGYKLKSVRDENGKRLDYEQNGDYITVFGNGNVSEIHMKYAGFSPQFYSNVQGISLPGYFPYLPHAGFSPVYDRQMQGFNRFYFDEGTIFNIKVNGLGRVYSNLQETDKNTFSGSAESVTLLRGLYAEYESHGIRIVYPFLETNTGYDNIDTLIEEYKGTECLGDNIKTILIEANTNLTSAYNEYVAYSDYIVCSQLLGLDEAYDFQVSAPGKYNLSNTYNYYINSGEAGLADIKMLAEGMPDSTFAKLLSYLDYYGEEEGSKRIEAFLNDNGDTRTDKQFFADEQEEMK